MPSFRCHDLRRPSFALIALVAVSTVTLSRTSSGADKAPEATASASFDEPRRPANWGVNFGHWEPADGVLVCRQLAADQHAAASRWQVPMSDGIVALKLRLRGASAVHVGFDPAQGELDKRGHLYSLIVTPKNVSLKKHKDKADPRSQEETLATAGPTPEEEWISVQLETRGDTVTARVGENLVLEATDPTFHVKKPAVVFRVIGSEAHLDDVVVTVLK